MGLNEAIDALFGGYANQLDGKNILIDVNSSGGITNEEMQSSGKYRYSRIQNLCMFEIGCPNRILVGKDVRLKEPNERDLSSKQANDPTIASGLKPLNRAIVFIEDLKVPSKRYLFVGAADGKSLLFKLIH